MEPLSLYPPATHTCSEENIFVSNYPRRRGTFSSQRKESVHRLKTQDRASSQNFMRKVSGLSLGWKRVAPDPRALHSDCFGALTSIFQSGPPPQSGPLFLLFPLESTCVPTWTRFAPNRSDLESLEILSRAQTKQNLIASCRTIEMTEVILFCLV